MIKVLAVASLALLSADAYTAKDREDTNDWIKSQGFPLLDAFTNMTPKMTKTVFETYARVTNNDAFEYLDAFDLEIIYTAVSAANNCELCLSFHAAVLVPQSDKVSAEDVNEIVQGGLPKDTRLRGLVQAAKYALAHKGALLPREISHLKFHGIDSQEHFLEIAFAAGFMSANNMIYIHMINNGQDLEEFLQNVGPFKDTVYSGKGEL